MRTADLDYDLPEELIAQFPTADRSACRLLVVDRDRGQWFDHLFADLPQLLRPNDIVVINNTRVLPARFFLRRASGGRIEGLWTESEADGDWRVLLRGASRVRAGEDLAFEPPGVPYRAEVLAKGRRGLHRLRVSPAAPPEVVLEQVGMMPLPHYIKRHGRECEALDRSCYQTVYASQAGAVAAPTAGLHFDEPLLDRLRELGVQLVEVTLHVGLGTFQPIEVDRLEQHAMHGEHYCLSAAAWEAITEARRARRRVVAVGTTSVRALESAAHHGRLSGKTTLFIHPPHRFQVVDALLTNFHLPRSTLLAMIYAFGGTALMSRAYAHAIAERYRFYSYGDAMLIL